MKSILTEIFSVFESVSRIHSSALMMLAESDL
jgi:hypothetical protein